MESSRNCNDCKTPEITDWFSEEGAMARPAEELKEVEGNKREKINKFDI